jgi:hypothetical protein
LGDGTNLEIAELANDTENIWAMFCACQYQFEHKMDDLIENELVTAQSKESTLEFFHCQS